MVEPVTTAVAPPALVSAEEALALAGSLSTWRTVDRRLVHKTALTEVLLTDLRALDGDRVALASQWPRSHALFQPTLDTTPDPLLFVETLRQGGIYLSHQHLGVPLDSQFVFESIAAEYLQPGPLPRADGETMVVLVIAVAARRRGDEIAGAALQIEAWSGARRFATARATYRCLPPEVYERLRSATAPPALPVPRQSQESDAGPAAQVSVVAVDPRNPTFFDHGADHLPGMLLIDAALRAGRPALAADPAPWGFALRFERFAELGVPTTVATRPASTGTEVVLAQPDGVVARGTVHGYPAVESPVAESSVVAGRS